MDIKSLYSTAISPSPFTFVQYKPPHQYQDPLRQIIERQNMNYKKKSSQGKFKPSPRKKQFFIDEQIKQIKDNPSPNRYKTDITIFKQKNKSKALNNKINPNVLKNTYIDMIQNQHKKNKKPGIGNYNLLTITDFKDTQTKKLKIKQNPQKISAMDDILVLAAQKPGPGQYTPYTQIKRIRPDRTTYKFYQQKHKKQQEKLKRSHSAKLSPCTYNPVHYNTFESIRINSKGQIQSLWSHGIIQKRKGLKSGQKYPGPADYKLINQWSPLKLKDQNMSKQKKIGELDLLGRTAKSARSLNIYRD